MLKCLFPRVNYCGIAAKNIRQKYIIQQICINNPGNIRGLSHFRHTIKCNEHIHSRYFHTEYIWYFYSSSPHNDSIFLNCICRGYKMPACLRPGLSSSSPLPVTCVWVSGLACPHHWHNQTLHSLYTLSHTPYSHLLSTLSIDQWPQTNIRHWRDVEDWDYS